MNVQQGTQRMTGVGRICGLLGVIGIAASCFGDGGTAPSTQPASETLGALVAFPVNAIMAIGDTTTITFTATTIAGTPATTFDSVTYFLQNPADTIRVQLSQTGLVTARAVSLTNNPVLVNIFAFRNGVAAADQVAIQIVATAVAGVTLSIHPVAPDSAKMSWGSTKTIIPVIQNAARQKVASPIVRYEYGPGDSAIMQCYVPNFQGTTTLSQKELKLSNCGINGNTGSVALNRIHAFQKGTPWIHANVRVFGVMLRDSVQYTITNPYSGSIQIAPFNLSANSPSNADVLIAPGGTVQFYNGFPAAIGGAVSFTFDNPAAATSANPPSTYGDSTGNISSITVEQLGSARRFLTAGVYTWTATVTGGIPPYTGATTTGKIRVE
jgi:hypothetical protein